MQAIKCELCGSNEFTKVDGLFQCNHCNTKYTLEEAKKLIVSGTVEVVKGNAEKERLINKANFLKSLNEIEKANSIFLEIIDEYPDDYRGWYGAFDIIKYKILNKKILPNSGLPIALKYAKFVMINSDTNEITDQILNDINLLKSYFNEKLSFDMYEKGLLCSFKNIFKHEIEIIERGIKYRKRINMLSDLQKIMLLESIDDRFAKKIDKSNNLGYFRLLKAGYVPYCKCIYNSYYLFYACGAYQDTPDYFNFNYTDFLEPIIKQVVDKSSTYCPDCGVPFKLFSKKCPKCGKPKDY